MIWLPLLLTCCCVSCQLDNGYHSPGCLAYIEINSKDGWAFQVFKDGSACLCCRIHGLTEVCLPHKSVSFRQFETELRHTCQQDVGAYHIYIQEVGQSASFHLLATDSIQIGKWFSHTFQKAQSHQNKNYNKLLKLKKLWRNHPPSGATALVKEEKSKW